MTYVMSDLHGMYDKYLQILDKIRFTDDDMLFVLGDVVDYGPSPCRILRDMSCRSNVFPILGNHDFLATITMRRLMERPETLEEDTDLTNPASTASWLSTGGQATYDDFQKLPVEEREWLLDYLGEFSLYEVVTVGDQKYILVHGGLGNYAPGRKMADYTPKDLLYGPVDPTMMYYKKSVLVYGHTPTWKVDEASRNRIWHGPRQLCIDCGSGHGGLLGCMCLDTGEEFYA